MEQSVSIVLVGIGGYGNNYLKVLWEEFMFNRIQGVVDIAPENSDYHEQLKEADIPVFSSMESFYEKYDADLAVISTPIHFHTAQTICALENGSHVLCEKPMTPSLEDAETIIRLKREKNAFVAIGFDWSFSRVIQQVKQDVTAGRFGEARRMKTLALWPRTEEYYERASWAGKKYAADRTPIFDSVVNNATSHFLHNMFYILGSRPERSAPLKELTAELYRANDIETFDTCALKGETEGGVPVYFLASHAVTEEIGPIICYEFEHAVLTYVHHEQELKAEFTDGTVVTYGNPENERSFKLYHCMEAVQEQRTETLCGPEAALSHLHAINALHESVPEAERFPEEITKYDPQTRLHYVEGLDELLKQCYEDWQLPSEKGTETWTKQGRTISIPANSLS
ncbi:Gfo/Idh/MocA family protein [Salibacterium halotolerans]|uniref:Predicted dehydrogenase n=1 Tax=Salibacterium halotolerans TaxID=1884432 RepID=A0A1I5W8G9_9BACI|nr:Gfo/Idh/MocA family oxidoreductase [Salibacterium halotolerans]SFQ16032.1 Predicted dehydrogenase [Salibacterium halotolerans]